MALTFLALILGVIPSFAWLFFFLKEDVHPEPKKMIVITFLSGLVAALFALFVEYILSRKVVFLHLENYGMMSLLIMAAVEEIVKFFCVFLLIKESRHFDEPIDAMIYLVTVALGFAAFENLAISFNLCFASLPHDLIFNQITATTIFRFIGATLLHALSSAVVGFWWAMGIMRHRTKKFIFNGLIIAVLLHTFFNYLILLYKDTIIYPTIFLSIIAFFIFLDFDQLRKKNP